MGRGSSTPSDRRMAEERRSTRDVPGERHAPVTAETLRRLRFEEGVSWDAISERYGRSSKYLQSIMSGQRGRRTSKRGRNLSNG